MKREKKKEQRHFVNRWYECCRLKEPTWPAFHVILPGRVYINSAVTKNKACYMLPSCKT